MTRPDVEFPVGDYLNSIRAEELAERIEKHKQRVERAAAAVEQGVKVTPGHPNSVQQGQLEALLAIADAVERIATALEATGK